jgi:hypothetical protein
VSGPLLLVLGDSLAFHGPKRAEPADDPRLWPNVAAAALGGRAELVAGFGWSARDAWWALTRDPRVWALLSRIDALILGVGSMDSLPSPLPTPLREGLRYLRPDGLRRRVRDAYLAAQPVLARAQRFTPGGRPLVLPPAATARYLESCRAAVHQVRPEVAVIGVLPSLHRAAGYGGVHSGRAATAAAIRRWAASSGVELVDLAAVAGEHVRSGAGNPDGMHWGWEAHAAVGAAAAVAVRRALGRRE